MTYEWEEEIPQPKPPTNRVRLAVETLGQWESGRAASHWGGAREAALADIARAIGVELAALEGFVKHKHIQDMAARPPVTEELPRPGRSEQYQNGNNNHAHMYGPQFESGIGGGLIGPQYQNLGAQGASVDATDDPRLRIGIPKKSGGGKSG